MKRTIFAAVLVAAGVVGATTGCGTWNSAKCWFSTGRCLTYEEYLSVEPNSNPPPSASEVLAKLGKPMKVMDTNGVRRRIDYHSETLTGEMRVAEFYFDEQEKLVKKELW
jgi:hypothetical protein